MNPEPRFPRRTLAGIIQDRLDEISEMVWGRLDAGEFGSKDLGRLLYRVDDVLQKAKRIVKDMDALEKALLKPLPAGALTADAKTGEIKRGQFPGRDGP